MPRKGKRNKGRLDFPPMNVIQIDDSDDDNGESESFNSQIQQMEISPIDRNKNSQPSWGVGAVKDFRQPGLGDGRSGSQDRGNAQKGPPNLSGFIGFSDPTMAASRGITHFASQSTQMMNMPGPSPLRLPLPVPGQSLNIPHQQVAMMFNRMRMQQPGSSHMRNTEMGRFPMPVQNTQQIESADLSRPKEKNGPAPGTKITRDKEAITIRKHRSRGGPLNVSDVDASIEECAEILSKAGQHVSFERLEAMILEKYQVRSFHQLNLQCRNFQQMPKSYEISRLLGKVNSYVHSFVRARSMCTLYELGECMREFHKDKLEFENLGLGPLQAMPVVYELFKFPMDEYIPEVTSLDIIEHLNGYLNSSQRWTDNSVQLDDFMEYLVTVYKVESPYSLGVRIRSMPLAIQMLKKSKRDAGQSRKKMLDSLGFLLIDDISKAVNRFKESILQSDGDSLPQLRLHYTSLHPPDAVKEIYSKFEVLAVLMEDEGSVALQNKMIKFHTTFAAFKRCIEKDALACHLFHLAVCLSVDDVKETAVEFLDAMKESKENESVQKGSGKPVKPKPKPSLGSLGDKIIHYLNQCLQDGSLMLSHLRRIEERVIEVYDHDSFDELGQGTFLNFLLSNSKIKEVLDDCGGAMLGSMGSFAEKVRCFHPTFTDLKELVCQAKHAGVVQNSQVAAIMCEQFGVKDVKSLGQGSVSRLCQVANTPGKHISSQYNCHYEAALCGKSCPSMQGRQSVGGLGNQSRERALAALTSCPLLEDMGEWTLWGLVFQPEHGDLKDFVARYGGRQVIPISGGKQEAISNFSALETEPGKLLKICSQSTADAFNEALNQNDPLLAAGHLASVIAESKGVESAPLALLANHVNAKLLSLRAQQGAGASQFSNNVEDPKVVFVTSILMKLPLRICAAVASQVLLDPLNQVVGSTKSKLAVMQVCQLPWQKQRLETLGILLGIPEWTKSLQDKMVFPAHLVQNAIVDELFGDAFVDEEVDRQDAEDEKRAIRRDDGLDITLEDEDESQQAEEETGGQKDNGGSDESPVTEKEQNVDAVKDVQGNKEVDNTDDVNKKYERKEKDAKKDKVDKEKCDKKDDVNKKEIVVKEDDDIDKDAVAKGDAVGNNSGTEGNDFVKNVEEEIEKDVKVTQEDTGSSADDEESSNDETDTSESETETKVNKEDQSVSDESSDEESDEESEPPRPLTREEMCHQIIDSIRREEFGVGIKLNKEASQLMKVQQERQGRSLKRLSTDLYSKDTHFVLELIQNADDNPYSPDIVPTLKFIIDTSGVSIQNNELGFEENNIRALCDVGKSTKSKHQAGYIGQKGIGFKSVFRVTDCPEIHSNGFHICFDVESGPMGYIMPHWMGNSDKDDSDWKTQIVLSWKEEIKKYIQTHAARFNDIQPSLLLFLHRLRKIIITNEVEGCEMVMSRQDFPTGEVQISHSNGMDRWLVVRKVLDATDVSLEARSGIEVTSTEIALAFPLLKRSSLLCRGARQGQLPVFAFLPLQSYGFRFIVQGDFNVPSSREAVDKDSPWNQWLRDKIPFLFIEAWESFLNLPFLSAMEAFILYLQFIPLDGEILGFFKPVSSLIYNQLVTKDCMPVIGTSDKKDEILWKAPSKTVMTSSKLVREIISPQLLFHNLGLYYLHWEVLEAVEHGMLSALGVNTIDTDHLIKIGQSVSANWDDMGNADQVTELAKWMASIYCSLDHLKENTEIFNGLKKMKIIPLGNGGLVSLEDVTVFLLTDDQGKSKAKKAKGIIDSFEALRQDVNIIHPALTSTDDSEINSQVTKLLNRLEVKQLTSHDIIYGHVLPVLRSNEWKTKKPEVLISYLICAKQVLFDANEDLSTLKEVARVVTNQGVKHPSEDNVHFHKDYACQTDLQQVFPMMDWIVLDPGYLPSHPSKTEQQSWRAFFTELGVMEFLCINSKKVNIDRTGNLTNSPWVSYSDLWHDLPNTFVIEDFACEEFHSLVTTPEVPYETMCHLYDLLETQWDTTYKQYTKARLVSHSGEEIKCDVDTSFTLHLRQCQWVPATWTMNTSDTQVERHRGLLNANQLYCPTFEVEQLLAHTAKYLAVRTNPKSSFTQFLQIRSSVKKEDVKEALISWGRRTEGKENIPAKFTTQINHIIQVYKYLQHEFPAGQIQDLFHKHPVIFIGPLTNAGIMTGQMMFREEMWWSDVCGLFIKYADSLEKYKNPLVKYKFMLPFYKGSEDLFTIARIERTHNMIHLAELLKHITSVYTLKDEGVLHDVLCLFTYIGCALSKADETEAGVRTQAAQVALELKGKVKSILEDCAVFPTKAMMLVALKDEPMIADDKELAKMFEDQPLVHFLSLESPKPQVNKKKLRHGGRGPQAFDPVDPEMMQFVIELFEEIKPLSDCINSQEITSGFKQCSKGQEYMHQIVGVLQQFLYFSFPEVYTEFKTNNAHQLTNLIFTEVHKLEVKYELTNRSAASVIRKENCIIKGNHFYFLAENINNQSEINKEVAKFFSNGDEECVREIRSFLSQAVPILEGKSEESFEDLLSRQHHSIGTLPEDEAVWEVPLPVIPSADERTTHEQVASDQQPMYYSTQEDPSQATPGGHQDNSGSGEQGEKTLKSWPPRSSGNSEPAPGYVRPGVQKQSKFTPPQAPDYKKTSKQIPANFRFENEPEMKQKGKGSRDDSKGRKKNEPKKDDPELNAKTQDSKRKKSGNNPEKEIENNQTELGGGDAGRCDEERVEDESNIMRGKRKLTEGSSSGEEGESRTPAYKRLSLESPERKTGGEVEHDEDVGGAGMDICYNQGRPRPLVGQGLVAVTRQTPNDSAGPSQSQSQRDQSRDSHSFKHGQEDGRDRSRKNVLNFNIPVWSDQVDSAAFTELTSDISKITVKEELGDNPNKLVIGRWGEMLVHDYLLQQKKSNPSVEDIIWANAENEQGLPYDFEVMCKTEGSDDQFYSVFIEVKTTRSNDKAVFEISSGQVEFALNEQERYQIFRVYGAGKDSLQLVRIDNIADRMKTKSVQLLMVI